MENQIEENKRTLVKAQNPELNHPCPLCESIADYFCSIGKKGRDYYTCSTCHAVFLHPRKYIDYSSEKSRYEEHNNDVKDPRYKKFVNPITDAVEAQFPKTADGLDYGCGTGPVASVVLEENGFKKIALYDPFFFPETKPLTKKYDFIICCEVMEHFFQPKEEFSRLRNLLRTSGKLFCKTSILKDNIGKNEFKDWWYNNDPTHVFFYTPKTLRFIAENFDFNKVLIESKLITFG
ncbi:class I SAM-dependent methyltransferase [Psychroflexus sediminis]|uniref:Methyltransferase domain-containing protein n=1 Tax=Psychroflexus sediminis TaxID=470826 RepID=A0A1G7YY50_9FLAO|nr:class I SAM-dependent methyltransferase [Psychroflexus sediminis]SDH00780.1 Methyltransferase domain-containing protein [Psychroflexus sediminis]